MIRIFLTLLVLSSSAISESDDRFAGSCFSIDSSPDSAEVYINGEYQGYTPLTDGRLDSGTILIEVKKNGYNNYKKKTRIRPFQDKHYISMVYLEKFSNDKTGKQKNRNWFSELNQYPEILNSLEYRAFEKILKYKDKEKYSARYKALIGITGNVRKAYIIKSTGYADVDSIISKEIIMLKFKPAMTKNNKSINFWIESGVTIHK